MAGILDRYRPRGILAAAEPRGILSGGWEAERWGPMRRRPVTIDSLNAEIAGILRERARQNDFRANLNPPRNWGEVGQVFKNAFMGAAQTDPVDMAVQTAQDVRNAIQIGERGDGNPWADVGDVGVLAMNFIPGARKIRAYHGSPHDFDRFDMSRIGTGEGAQVYGHGLYFAEKEGVARSYRDALATDPRDELNRYLEGIQNFATRDEITFDAIKAGLLRSDYGALRLAAQNDDVVRDIVEVARGRNADGTVTNSALAAYRRLDSTLPKPAGRMYEVEIDADPEQFLDWDAPLTRQSPEVQRGLAQFGFRPSTEEMRAHDDALLRALMTNEEVVIPKPPYDPTGGAIYESRKIVPGDYRDSAAASANLREAGIPGIRYLDQLSRPAGEGTRNYVVFDDKLIRILRKYGVVMTAGGATGAAMFSADDPALAQVPLDAWSGAAVVPAQ